MSIFFSIFREENMRKYLRKIKASHYVILTFIAVIYGCNWMCTSVHPPIRDDEGAAFAGSATCASCHKDIYRTHTHTAHYLDSRPASKKYIKGSFDSGKNHFVYNKETEVVLEQKDQRFFQTSFINGNESQSHSFDIVIGSGRKGQTYLYWNNGNLFQLPISYSTAMDSWCNSPGYPADAAIFNRRVPSYCLECHSTYAGTEERSMTDKGREDNADKGIEKHSDAESEIEEHNSSDKETIFRKDQIIYGIDCEKCHGPAAEHVAFQTDHPQERKGRYIINAKNLSRQQRLDVCALCHSGARVQLRPAFSFKVGDTLNRFSLAKFSSDDAATLDVHGNQYGLLTSSKCFRLSQMDCSSCHNVHVNEANGASLFSQRCMTCHNESTHITCSINQTPGLLLSNNCIDCHMPALPSQKILLALSNGSKTIHNLVRTHRIAIYPESTKEYLQKIKDAKATSSTKK